MEPRLLSRPWHLHVAVCLCAPWLLASVSAEPVVFDQPFAGVSVRSRAIESRFLRKRQEQEPVSTTVLDASVTGTQSTVTETRMKIVPDANRIALELVNSGDVSSRTTGVNRQALVETTGRHHFVIIKPVWFDGRQFLTQHGHGTIQATTTPSRVRSAAGATMPLLSRIGDRVAWNEVMRRQPLIDRAAAEDVSRDVLPRVDQLVDQDFAQLNRQWQAFRSQLEAGLNQPVTWSASSSADAIRLVASLNHRGATRAADLHRALTLRDGEDVVVSLSDDVLAGILAPWLRDSWTVSDTQLQQVDAAFRELAAEEITRGRIQDAVSSLMPSKSSPASLFSIEFAAGDAIRVRFDGGDIVIGSKFQIHPTIGASSGWMTSSIRLRGRAVTDDAWAVVLRDVEVDGVSVMATPAAADSSVRNTPAAESTPDARSDGLQIPRDTDAVAPRSEPESAVTSVTAGMAWPVIVRTTLRSLVEKAPVIPVPLEVNLAAIDASLPRVRLTRIESSEGVLRVSARLVERPAVAATGEQPAGVVETINR